MAFAPASYDPRHARYQAFYYPVAVPVPVGVPVPVPVPTKTHSEATKHPVASDTVQVYRPFYPIPGTPPTYPVAPLYIAHTPKPKTSPTYPAFPITHCDTIYTPGMVYMPLPPPEARPAPQPVYQDWQSGVFSWPPR